MNSGTRPRPNTRWNFGALASIMATFIGTVVGAGFASGQEILQFFSRYGCYGGWGIFLSVLILGTCGVKIYRIGYSLRPQSYQDFLMYLLGPRLVKWADAFLSFFFIVLIAVMFAGCGAIFETLKIGYGVGVVGTALILIMVLFRELSGLIAVNLLVIPLMFLGSLLISGHAILQTHHPVSPYGLDGTWFLAAAQFSAYNLVLAMPVLLALGKRYPAPKTLKLGGWLGSVGLGIMSFFIHGAIVSQQSVIWGCPLPMMELSKLVNHGFYWGYALVLWGEMLTTLLANTFGVATRLAVLTHWPYRFWVIGLTLAGIMVARFGFVSLIAGFYPFFGCVCIIFVILILIKKPPQNPRFTWE